MSMTCGSLARLLIVVAVADCCRRLVKENVKPIGRLLGKLTHSNPGVVLEYIVDSIQMHDDFAQVAVDAFKYLSRLSFDVLSCMSKTDTHARML
jgi:THO complex subunit 2